MPSPAPRFEVRTTAACERMLRDIKRQRGRQTYEQLKSLILDLATDPEMKTQALTGLLKGFRSLHSGRFRIVVQVDRRVVRVYVVGVGWHSSGERDDIYQVLQRMIRAGTLPPPGQAPE